ncbi:MAG: AAA family ATPase [Gammaproteobacteria bacterium]
MIRSLELRNWKAYEVLQLTFEEGTTFLVARNGVGKSSIVQAIAFGLFGDDHLLGSSNSHVRQAVRGAPGTEAYVQVSLALGGDDLTVRRTIIKSERSNIQTSVQVNGELASEKDLRERIRSHVRVDATQLEMLSVVAEGKVLESDDAGVDIAAMLSETFGVDRLKDQAARTKRRAGQIEREADAARRSLRDVPSAHDASRRKELESTLRAVSTDLEVRRSELQRARSGLAAAHQWTSYEAAAADFEQTSQRREAQTGDLLRESRQHLGDILGPSPRPDGETSLEELLNAGRLAIQERTDRLARLEADAEAARSALRDLAAGRGVCPTCRRPLTPAENARAKGQNESILTESVASSRTVETEKEALHRVLTRLEQESRRPQPSPPPVPGVPHPDAGLDLEATVAGLESGLDELNVRAADLKAEINRIDADQRAREANDALTMQLVRMYHKAEVAYALTETLTDAADAITAERITPLATEVEKRWASVWRLDPLQMDGRGALSLSAGGDTVPFSQFSGGQRTIAQVLVRILALQMATRSPFLILDEPLEHLDPRNRRLLASLLVSASSGATPLRQVIVTTYEESVTRRLTTWQGTPGPGEDGSFGSRVVQVSPPG